MDMRNRWETGDTNSQRGPWEPPTSPIEPRPLSMVLSKLLDAAADAFDVDQEQSRALLSQARVLLNSCAAHRGLAGRAPAQPALAAWQAKRIARHIDENLDRALLLGEIAGVVGLSTSYFSRAFKGTFGQSPHAFILGRRVARACGEMLGGREPLAQIALSCGFADQAHLARIFRRQMGAPPSAWRRDNIVEGAIPHRNAQRL
jgi:AraC family transcriptional regulator